MDLSAPWLRLAVVSDLRWDLDPGFKLDPADVDAWAVAGNAGPAGSERQTIASLAEAARGRPVLYVPGDLELRGTSLAAALGQWRRAARGTCVRILYRQRIRLGQVLFLGTTLWSGFGLFGRENKAACQRAFTHLFDTRGGSIGDRAILRATGEMEAEHKRDLKWLARQASVPGPKVLLVHFAPSARSLGRRPMHPALAYCANPMDEQVRAIGLCIHGHLEARADYRIGRSPDLGRVLANPRHGQCLPAAAAAPLPVPRDRPSPMQAWLRPRGQGLEIVVRQRPAGPGATNGKAPPWLV